MRSGALREFSKTTAVSQRSFIEKFKKLYLLTPGEYIKLKQVNYAARHSVLLWCFVLWGFVFGLPSLRAAGQLIYKGVLDLQVMSSL